MESALSVCVPMTPQTEEGYLLRVFIGESDKNAGKPLFEWIAVQAGLRGRLRFGAASRQIQTFRRMQTGRVCNPRCSDLPSLG